MGYRRHRNWRPPCKESGTITDSLFWARSRFQCVEFACFAEWNPLGKTKVKTTEQTEKEQRIRRKIQRQRQAKTEASWNTSLCTGSAGEVTEKEEMLAVGEACVATF